MSLASSRLSLLHRTTVLRDQNAGTLNAAGAPQAPNWQAHLTELPCRFWTRAGREMVDATTIAVLEDMRMVVSLGTDITEIDQIGDITYRGAIIASGPIDVSAVVGRKDHLELLLARIA